MLGPPRALQLPAVLAVVAPPAPTLLGAALGVLLPPAPHTGRAGNAGALLGGSLF